jgi:hypothetical protein
LSEAASQVLLALVERARQMMDFRLPAASCHLISASRLLPAAICPLPADLSSLPPARYLSPRRVVT